ncbi:MAG: AAA family ATPase [Ruminococcus sp.]|nr:AAA family ATPase [Ruminococcus sp.]
MFENGVEYIRADFHLHTRKDKEFKYTGEENDFVKLYVQGLIDAGISIGVITNHNKFDENEYKAIRKSAKKQNILILPGVELSVKEGANGIHTLIIFNPDEWIQNGDNHIQSFLASAFAGISNPENRNTRCNYDLRTMFERLDAYGKDYFIVFAHVDQGNGLFEECKGGMLESIAETASFQKRVLGLQKSRTYSNLDKFKEYFGYLPALVEGSDPKSITQIGKGDKASFLKIGEFSYSAVKFTLQDHSNRVFESKPSNNHGFIDSISFQGGRFDGQTIHFSSSLNTLIGIRGSGKSAILESIRYILGIDPQADKSYKTDLIKNIWGSGGKATLLIYDKHGRKYYISRILNERITVLDENGDDLNINPLSLLDGVQYFGQKDLSTSADQENTLLSKLVGTSIDNEAVTEHINELITMYEHMQKFS